jgi:hypothetical protein
MTRHDNSGDRIPSCAGTANQIEVIAGKWHFFEFLLSFDPIHHLSQYEKLGQAAYATAI